MHGAPIWGLWKVNGSRKVGGKKEQNLKHHLTGGRFPIFTSVFPSLNAREPKPEVGDRMHSERAPGESL